MNELPVVLISGSCCNPILKETDSKFIELLDLAAKEENVKLVKKTVSISSIAFSGLFFSKETNNKISKIIKEKGIGILPLVVIDGDMILYGNVPLLNEVKEKIRLAIQNQISKPS